MPPVARVWSLLHTALGWGLVLGVAGSGCGSGDDYYSLIDIRGGGDTAVLVFVYTCGVIDIAWDGSFGGPAIFRADLAVHHDAPGGDCDEHPREVPYDIGSMKRSFRALHPWPVPLGLRVAPYEDEEEQSARCLPNVFQNEPFKGQRCK